MHFTKPNLFKNICSALLSAVLFSGCTFSTTTSGNAELTTNMAALKNSIDSLVPNEGINLSGTNTNTNGIKTNSVSLEIINGKNIPSEEAGVNELGKKIALKLKRNLKNPGQYNKYEVLFNTQKSSGAFTESRKVSYECDSKDL